MGAQHQWKAFAIASCGVPLMWVITEQEVPTDLVCKRFVVFWTQGN